MVRRPPWAERPCPTAVVAATARPCDPAPQPPLVHPVPQGVRFEDLLHERLCAMPFDDLLAARLRPVVDVVQPNNGSSIYRKVLEQVEGTLVRLALERTGGNQSLAAELLGISRNTLKVKRELLERGPEPSK